MNFMILGQQERGTQLQQIMISNKRKIQEVNANIMHAEAVYKLLGN